MVITLGEINDWDKLRQNEWVLNRALGKDNDSLDTDELKKVFSKVDEWPQDVFGNILLEAGYSNIRQSYHELLEGRLRDLDDNHAKELCALLYIAETREYEPILKKVLDWAYPISTDSRILSDAFLRIYEITAGIPRLGPIGSSVMGLIDVYGIIESDRDIVQSFAQEVIEMTNDNEIIMACGIALHRDGLTDAKTRVRKNLERVRKVGNTQNISCHDVSLIMQL